MGPGLRTTLWHEIGSPVGRLLLVGDGTRLQRIEFQGGPRPRHPPRDWIFDPDPFRPVTRQLGEYFAGERRSFELPLDARGTAFQQRVWRAFARIPYGQTVSYGELARRIGVPGAARAVGLANGANPLPIIWPCHRVIGADGSLIGFGGGLAIKRRLLSLEGWAPQEQRPSRQIDWVACLEQASA